MRFCATFMLCSRVGLQDVYLCREAFLRIDFGRQERVIQAAGKCALTEFATSHTNIHGYTRFAYTQCFSNGVAGQRPMETSFSEHKVCFETRIQYVIHRYARPLLLITFCVYNYIYRHGLKCIEVHSVHHWQTLKIDIFCELIKRSLSRRARLVCSFMVKGHNLVRV